MKVRERSPRGSPTLPPKGKKEEGRQPIRNVLINLKKHVLRIGLGPMPKRSEMKELPGDRQFRKQAKRKEARVVKLAA